MMTNTTNRPRLQPRTPCCGRTLAGMGLLLRVPTGSHANKYDTCCPACGRRWTLSIASDASLSWAVSA